jgi:hypothetical protein
MNRKTFALAVATMVLVGCTPTRLAARRDDHTVLPPLGESVPAQGQVIVPKRCSIRLVVLSRPINDEAINQKLWSVADEQALAPEVRQRVEANGLRFGLVSGSLPLEVEEIVQAPPPNKVEPTLINIASGDNPLFSVCPATSKISLILSGRNGSVVGKDFNDARALFRVTATHDGPKGVALRFVPEVHHGPIQHRYVPDTSTNPFAVPDLLMKDGQQEDSLRDLAATITLQPGQIAVVGCQPDRPRSLGHFMLTEPEANSDRMLQKVLLVWASQANDGAAVLTAPDTPVRRGPSAISHSTEVPPASALNQTHDRPL